MGVGKWRVGKWRSGGREVEGGEVEEWETLVKSRGIGSSAWSGDRSGIVHMI